MPEQREYDRARTDAVLAKIDAEEGAEKELEAEAPVRPSRQALAALGLRLAGASYEEIAEALGLAGSGMARESVEGALGKMAVKDRAGRDRLRTLEGARLERLLRSLWQKATDPTHPEHIISVRAAVTVIDRHIRLFGLDAPSEVVVHSPTTAEIDAWVGRLVEKNTEELRAMEAGVIDVEEAS